MGQKIKNAKGLVFALLFTWTGWVAACEDLLRASPHRVPVEKFYLSAKARLDVAALGVTVRQVESFFLPDDYVPVSHADGTFWLVVFNHQHDDRDRGHMDKGFLITGHSETPHFRIDHIQRAARQDEQLYFRAIALVHKLEEGRFSIRRALLNCATVFVKPWTQVKLWLKHRLRVEDIREVIENPIEGPFVDPSHGKNRYALRGWTRDGRFLRAVISTEDQECPLTLITSFEEDY